MNTQRPRVVIIGAGFGGLYAARHLEGKAVDVLIIDRQNFHTFTPLLYQVATCGLDPSEIAYPIRSIFDAPNIQFVMGKVTSIDLTNRQVEIALNGQTRIESYDYLIVAAGSTTNFFGNSDLEQFAFGLKDLQEAVKIRHHILHLFEKATWTEEPEAREALTTIVVVGGGPTGLETSGALHELYNHVLNREYQFENLHARVVLVEAVDRLLLPYPENLQRAAQHQLESLGVEVILNDPVDKLQGNQLILKSGHIIPTSTVIWTAGVKASPLAEMLGVELKRGGRVPVEPTMEVIGQEAVYVVGDMAYLEDDEGQAYPMLIPVAKQEGILAAQNILRRTNGESQKPFQYHDRGIMATIGRRRAVAWIYNRIPLTGFIAWLAWLGLHLLWLMGFRNRLNVLVNWIWNYLTYDRSVRIILQPQSNQSAAD
ncbi:MAG: NAD(P)/FAD-dependent oxidoreductase [Anaerolineae bacterium]|nr:NAD(P)/FAD-dependent oxidoreductase [Anaerolineae bacterium]